MKRSSVLAAVIVVGAASVPASAATIGLTFDVGRDPDDLAALGGRADGTLVYGMVGANPIQSFTAQVNGDDGAPVTGCLAAGAVALVDQRGATIGTATCAGSGGGFQFFTSISRPTTVRAVIAAPTTEISSGRPIGAVTSNAAFLMIQPKLTNLSPSVSRARLYPLRFRLQVPPPRPGAGVLVLQRKKGSTWATIASGRVNASGVWSTRAAWPARVNQFRVLFKPTAGSGWLQFRYGFNIRRTIG